MCVFVSVSHLFLLFEFNVDLVNERQCTDNYWSFVGFCVCITTELNRTFNIRVAQKTEEKTGKFPRFHRKQPPISRFAIPSLADSRFFINKSEFFLIFTSQNPNLSRPRTDFLNDFRILLRFAPNRFVLVFKRFISFLYLLAPREAIVYEAVMQTNNAHQVESHTKCVECK